LLAVLVVLGVLPGTTTNASRNVQQALHLAQECRQALGAIILLLLLFRFVLRPIVLRYLLLPQLGTLPPPDKIETLALHAQRKDGDLKRVLSRTLRPTTAQAIVETVGDMSPAILRHFLKVPQKP
jgi:hypothetical protein